MEACASSTTLVQLSLGRVFFCDPFTADGRDVTMGAFPVVPPDTVKVHGVLFDRITVLRENFGTAPRKA